MNTSEPILKNLPIGQVVASPTNPRKIFDIHKTEELAASIKEKGVIVPILCRPKGPDRYEIVYGERRWRASKLAEKKHIPATIREISDQEVREMQLIENFQREDVHAMEEAVAIYAAIKTGKYTIEELSQKVGKSPKYIAGRYKLNDLIPDLQQAFFDDKFTLKDALLLVTISAPDQTDFFKDVQKGSGGVYQPYRIQQAVNTYHGRLDTAVFSLEDPNLNPDMGACTKCHYNSNNANMMFTDNKPYPVCMHSQCFKKKNKVHYETSFKEVKNDPTVIPISTVWYGDKSAEEISKKEGITVLNPRQYETIEKPTFDEPARVNYGDEKQHRHAVEEAKTAHEKQLTEYNNKLASGRYKKAFVIEGSGRGAYVYVSLKKEAVQLLEKKADSTELNDIDEEIKRITDEEIKRKKTDQQHDWEKIADQISDEHLPIASSHWKAPLTQDERAAIAYALFYEIRTDYNDLTDWAASVLGLDSVVVGENDLPIFKKITWENLVHIFRIFMLSKLQDNDSDNLPKQMLLPILSSQQYLGAAIAEINSNTAIATTKREVNMQKRMAELEKRKDELLNPKPALKAGIAELATSAAPAAGGKPSLKPQVIEFVSYKKIPGKTINQFAAEVSQLNVKGDWMNDPATLDSAYKFCFAKVAVFNKESQLHTLKVFQEDDCVYISQMNHTTNKPSKFIGFELVKKEVANG